MHLASLALATILLATSGQTVIVPIEGVIKNAEAVARKKNSSGTWATVGRLYATSFEGEHDAEVWAAEKEPANAKGADPSVRIAPLKGGVEAKRTRAIEAYRKSVELDVSNAASWLALGWLYRSGDKPDAKLALQSYKKVDRLIPTPADDKQRLLLGRALDALEQLQEGDAAAVAEVVKRRRVLAK